MHKIDITLLPSYEYLIDFKVEDAKLAFKYTFVILTETTSKEWEWNTKKGKSELVDKLKVETTPLSRSPNKFKGDTTLIIKRGHLSWLLDWVINTGIPAFNVYIDLSESERNRLGWMRTDKLPLAPGWLEVFESHPRGEYYAQSQIDAFDIISKYDGCAIELGTGLGKSEIILATVDSILQHHETGNVLICVPTNAVFDEIWDRAGKPHLSQFQMQTKIGGWFDTSLRVNVINPVGFCNSSNSTDPDILEWMSNVKHVIVDEAHKLSSDSYQHVLNNICKNIQRAVAFSGTMDKFDARVLHPSSCNLGDLYYENMLVTGSTGAVMISRKVIVDTQVYTLTAEISDRFKFDKIMDAEEHWYEALNLMIYSMKFPGVIKRAYSHLESITHKNAIMYIPVITTESADYLGEVLHGLGYNVCVWYSGSVYLNGEYIGDSLEAVKKANADGKFQMLITSKVSYEGVDLTGINGCLPVVGSNWAMISQPLGRAARGTDLVVYLVMDTGNPLIMSQTTHRKKVIVREYNITKMESI